MLWDGGREAKNDNRRRIVFKSLIVLSLGGVVLILLWAIGSAVSGGGGAPLAASARVLAAFSAGTMVAGACFATGGLLGLIFGVPKTAESQNGESQGNTNLVQVSDWLTKMLLGVGLTQLSNLRDLFKGAAVHVARSFSNSAADQAFLIALMVYFLSVGFVFGYVATKVVLAFLLRNADKELQDALESTAATLSTIEDTVAGDAAAKDLITATRADVERALGGLIEDTGRAKAKINGLSRRYEEVRRTMQPGQDRTHEMAKLVSQARVLAPVAGYDAKDICKLFGGGGDGDRIVSLGLLQAMPDGKAYDIVEEAIRRSRSAFEQYHALRTAEALVPLLDDAQQSALRRALEDQRSGGPDKYITSTSDRWSLSQRILERLRP